jgi:hypothetical protein
MNRTCPEVVCAIIYLHWGELFLKHLELKTCGVWARIKILVSSYKSDDHMSPLKGQVHYIDCMFIHFFHACTRIKSGSPTSLQHPILSKKTLEIHSVLAASPIFKKVGVSEQKLDSPLAYSSKYWKISLGKFLSIDLSSLFKLQQWLNPKKLGGKHGEKPQHNSKGNCTAEWSQFLFC